MPSLVQRAAARLGIWHARRVYEHFLNAVQDVSRHQQVALQRAVRLVRDSDFGRRHGLGRVHDLAALRRALPLQTYEDYRPWVDRLCDGDVGALFAPRQRILMFATSSGTTALPKRIPVTPEFVADYRRGWNTFGLKLLRDHRRAFLRPILQSTGRHDAAHTPSGVPVGAITGLLARTQKRIVRRFYVGPPEIAHIDDPLARYYTLMRFGIVRDVAFAITANPATLIQMARTADEHSERLIRDVRDGTLAREFVPNGPLHRRLAAQLQPDPFRASELERLRRHTGALRPRDFWQLDFVACWTGGSMGYYLQRLADWWGPVPVRDIGLLASEGRVTIPLEDGKPVGVLDVTAAAFEFIPADAATSPDPPTLSPDELEVGGAYAVVLSNASGLLRYRLDDVVRMHGRLGQAPLLEFLHRAGRISSIAGEKLTEDQVVLAVMAARRSLQIPEFDFVLAPRWGDPPFYVLTCSAAAHPKLAGAVDSELAAQNEEYASRRKSLRLGALRIRYVPADTIPAMDRALAQQRRSAAEQYKRSCLFARPGEDDEALGLASNQVHTSV